MAHNYPFLDHLDVKKRDFHFVAVRDVTFDVAPAPSRDLLGRERFLPAYDACQVVREAEHDLVILVIFHRVDQGLDEMQGH
jgi:hypothetical protein